jgi:hypothetical protein
MSGPIQTLATKVLQRLSDMAQEASANPPRNIHQLDGALDEVIGLAGELAYAVLKLAEAEGR